MEKSKKFIEAHYIAYRLRSLDEKNCVCIYISIWIIELLAHAIVLNDKREQWNVGTKLTKLSSIKAKCGKKTHRIIIKPNIKEKLILKS